MPSQTLPAALELDNNLPRAYMGRGGSLLSTGVARFQALDDLNEAIFQDYQLARAYLNRSHVYYRQGKTPRSPGRPGTGHRPEPRPGRSLYESGRHPG